METNSLDSPFKTPNAIYPKAQVQQVVSTHRIEARHFRILPKKKKKHNIMHRIQLLFIIFNHQPSYSPWMALSMVWL